MKGIVDNEIEEFKDEINETPDDTWRKLEFDIDEKYEYIPKSKIFQKCSELLYYGVAIPVLYFLTKVIYDLKIEGKENILKLDGGAVSVSNHVLTLDCAMAGLALEDKKIYYTTLESNFKIPIVRKLIRLLRAIRIPIENKNKPYFIGAVDNILQNGDIVHFYPEAVLWNRYNKLRHFKTGAFRFAVKNDVPILPMVITFRRPNGMRRIFKNKSDVTLTILEPIKHEKKIEDTRKQIEVLKEVVYEKMNTVITNKRK